MIISRTKYELKLKEEVQEALFEEERKREQRDLMLGMERRLAELEVQMYDVRMKTDPEFRRRNTPVMAGSVCGEG